MYTAQEKIQMCLWYENNSLRQVRDLFAVEYPNRPIPNTSTIQRIFKKFRSEGCVVDHKKRNRQRTTLTEDMRLNIVCYVDENPFRSLKEVAAVFRISPSSVRNALKLEKWKSTKLEKHQQQFIDDIIRRTLLCELMSNAQNEDKMLLEKKYIIEEATVPLNETENSQNYRYWSR